MLPGLFRQDKAGLYFTRRHRQLFFSTGIFTAIYAEDPVEVRKIEYLLTRLETITDVRFIRNGTEYNAN
jgi:hypothetical protein